MIRTKERKKMKYINIDMIRLFKNPEQLRVKATLVAQLALFGPLPTCWLAEPPKSCRVRAASARSESTSRFLALFAARERTSSERLKFYARDSNRAARCTREKKNLRRPSRQQAEEKYTRRAQRRDIRTKATWPRILMPAPAIIYAREVEFRFAQRAAPGTRAKLA